MTTAVSAKPKIYHLIDNGQTSVEHYQRVNGNQRVKVDARKNDRPYLQITFSDDAGVNKTIRFKLNCNTPYQDEQIEKFKIPANDKFTNSEMDMLRFKNGVLYVTNESAKKFLDIHPQNECFTGQCPDIQGKLFREYNPTDEKAKEVSAFKNRAALANKIIGLDLEAAQSMLIRLNGSFYKAPTDLDDCVTQLVDIMDNSSDEEVLDLLRDGVSLEDEISILISKATNAGVLSFEEPGMENFVIKKVGGRSVPLKEISGKLPSADRRRLFSEFLASNDGTLHLEDLRKMVDGLRVNNKEESPKEISEDLDKDMGVAASKPLDKMNKEELSSLYFDTFGEKPDDLLTKKELISKVMAKMVS